MYQEVTTTIESKFAFGGTGVCNTLNDFDSKSIEGFEQDVLDENVITTDTSYSVNFDIKNSIVDEIQKHQSSFLAKTNFSRICERDMFFERVLSVSKHSSLNSGLYKFCEYALPELITFTEIFYRPIKNIYKPYFFLDYDNLYGDLEKIVKSLYAFLDFDKVNTYIKESTGLQFLLVETFYKLQEYFGDSAEFVLDYKTDVFDNGSEQLFIRVSSKNTLKTSLNNLDSFESEWYLERIANVLDSPVVTLTK